MAIAIRPGEHACSRFANAVDRERLAIGFVRVGLERGQKVVYLHDHDDNEEVLPVLLARDENVRAAVASGQLVLRQAEEAYRRDFASRRTLAMISAERDRALAEGFAGLCLIREMVWALDHTHEGDSLTEDERRLERLADPTLTIFCQYDYARFAVATLADVADAHTVDVAPELASIGRDGRMAAAVIQPGRVLRLAGDLDFDCSQTLADVIDGHFHGPLRLDLADLTYVDVAGMRALRGRTGQSLLIVAASEAVNRLMRLLAWDTDPNVEHLAV